MQGALLVTALLLANGPSPNVNQPRRVQFSAPIRAPSSLGPWTAIAFGDVPAPDVAWYGADPTGALGLSTFTSACTDVGNGSTPWGTSATFNGSSSYCQSDSGSVAEIETGDFTACALVQMTADAGAYPIFFSTRNTGSGYNCLGPNAGSTGGSCLVEDDSGANASELFPPAGGVVRGAWFPLCLRVDADGSFNTCVPGGCSAGTATPMAGGGVSSSQPLTLGMRPAAADLRLEGGIAGFWAWSSLLTEDQVGTLFDYLSGLLDAKSRATTTFTRASTRWCEADDGSFYAVANGMPCAEGNKQPATTNYSVNTLDWSARTAYGTPVITTNTTSGPLAGWYGGPESDTIEDDNAAGYEGVYIASETTYTGAYTAAVLARAGTLAAVKIYIATDGIGSNTCTFSGLDNLATAVTAGGSILCRGGTACTGSNAYDGGFARLVCFATIGGVPSATTASLRLGTAAADTGTIIASASDAWRSASIAPPCIDTDGTAEVCLGDATSWNISGSALTTPAILAVAVADGDMEEVGTASWTVAAALMNNAVLSKQAGAPGGSGSQVLQVTYGGTANPQAIQADKIAQGRKYRFSGWARGDGTYAPMVLNGNASVAWTGTSSTDWQQIIASGVSTTATTNYYLRCVAAGAGWCEFDSSGIVDITEELRGMIRCSGWFVPHVADYPTGLYNVFRLDNGTALQSFSIRLNGSEIISLRYDTGTGSETTIASGAVVPSPGVPAFIDARLNFDADRYEILANGVSIGASSAALSSPIGITTARLGAAHTGAEQIAGSADFYGWRCEGH